MSNQQTKLPPIVSKTESGPFKMPNDNDMLIENRRDSQEKMNQKIWDKATASCRTALKRFDKFKTAKDQKYVAINSFNHKEKKLIQTAMEIVQMRKKNKDLAPKNQAIVDILEQKKEMFLVTMTHQIIQKQINSLKEQAVERAKNLLESNEVLERDIDEFEQYREKYKNQTKKIQQKYEKQVQSRLVKEQQIKNKQITVNSLRAQKSRNQQNISSYLKYKKFLEQLPPKEWSDGKQQRKNVRLNQLKQRIKAQYFSKDTSKKRNQQQFNRYFTALVQSGQNQQIEQILNNQEMFFTEPHQLIQYFNALEQKNLFCIQNAQYAEQKYQQLKGKSEQKKLELIGKYQLYLQQKKQLEKQLNQLDIQIKTLKKKKQQNNLIDQKNNKDIKSTIVGEYQNMKDTMHSYMPQIQNNAQSLTLLSGIEICMERLWERLNECYVQNPKAIKQIKTNLQKKKNNEKRQQAARTNKMEQQRRKSRNLQKKAPVHKINGRIDMKRSPPQEKIIIKKLQTTGKDQDDDRKYLIQ